MWWKLGLISTVLAVAAVSGILVLVAAGVGEDNGHQRSIDIQRAVEDDGAEPRFTGRLGDFFIYEQRRSPPPEADAFRCPDGSPTIQVSDPDTLREHELWSGAFDDLGAVGWACGDRIILINNELHGAEIPDDDGTRVTRGYITDIPLPLLLDAPHDRLELTVVEGHPALLEHPIEGYPYATASIAVIERYPEAATPGIATIVTGAPTTARARTLAESLIP